MKRSISGPIQQILTLSTLDAIGKDSIVSAWVERRDNRMKVGVTRTGGWSLLKTGASSK